MKRLLGIFSALSAVMLMTLGLGGCDQPVFPSGDNTVYSYTVDRQIITNYMLSGIGFVWPDDQIIRVTNTGQGTLTITPSLIGPDSSCFSVTPLSAGIPAGDFQDFTLEYIVGDPGGETFTALVRFDNNQNITPPTATTLIYGSILLQAAEILFTPVSNPPLMVDVPVTVSTTDPDFTSASSWFTSDPNVASFNGNVLTPHRPGIVIIGFVFSEFPLIIKGQTFSVDSDMLNVTVNITGARWGDILIFEGVDTTATPVHTQPIGNETDITQQTTREALIIMDIMTLGHFYGSTLAELTGKQVTFVQEHNDYRSAPVTETLSPNWFSIDLDLPIPNDSWDNVAPWYTSVSTSNGTNATFPVKLAVDGVTIAPSRWATTTGSIPSTLTLMFSSPVTVNAARIFDWPFTAGSIGRTRNFSIQSSVDGIVWTNVHSETDRGTNGIPHPEYSFMFNQQSISVTARHFRLNINSAATTDPSIFEFELFLIAIPGLEDLLDAITQAENLLTNTHISAAGDGSEFPPEQFWVTQTVWNTFNTAVQTAKQSSVVDIAAKTPTEAVVAAALSTLNSAITGFNTARQPGDPQVVLPVIAPSINTVQPITQITITTTTPDADIWYTTNNTNPAVNTGTQYTGPFTMGSLGITTGTVTIRAIAVKAQWRNSAIAERTYTIDDNVITHEVTFNSAGGTPVAPEHVSHDGPITEPTPPTRTPGSEAEMIAAIQTAGLYQTPLTWQFDGWEDAGGNLWNFTTDTVTGPMTLTARWSISRTAVAANNIPAAFTHVNNAANPATHYVYAISENANIAVQSLSRANTSLTLIGLGGERIIRPNTVGGAASTVVLFNINGADRTLTLGNNITLSGHATTTLTGRLIQLQNGPTFIMLAGSKITGVQSNNADAIINMTGDPNVFSATVILRGGEIINNHTSSTSGWASAGINRGNNAGNIILESGRVSGNTQGTGSPPTAKDMFMDRNVETSGPGILRLSGNVEIGVIHASPNNIIEITGPYSGSIGGFIVRTADIANNAVFVRGTTEYTLTQNDLDNIAGGQPFGRWLELRPLTNDAILLATGQGPSNFTVTFNSAGGSAVSPGSISVTPNTAIGNSNRPADPTRTFASPEEFNAAITAAGLYRYAAPQSWVFDGWFAAGSSTAWNFETGIVTGSMTLTARWSVPAAVTGVAANNIPAAFTHVNTNDGNFVYAINDNVTNAAQSMTRNNTSLTLIGLGSERTIRPSAAGTLFTVSGGLTRTLILGNNITLSGATSGTASAALVSVDNANFIMLNGSKITGFTLNNGNFGAVTLFASAIFTMRGGEITVNTNNTASGGWLTAGVHRGGHTGRLIMEGGSISGNLVPSGTSPGPDILYENGTDTGDLYMQGDAAIGRMNFGGSNIIIITGPLTGTGGIETITLRTAHAAGAVFVRGTDTYTLTQADLNRLQGGAPGGRQLQLRPGTNDAILLAAP
ncbi:MAG: discoidin domain-containing protein [Treponema sp.]|nr:discoidin domain-containing protein [Treponema sp.]